ncbi:MAG: hypothetical protein QNK11_03240 [Legionella sp.]|nr:hypothetical protein [Legionella sp.]
MFAFGTISQSISLRDAAEQIMKELPQVDKNPLLYLKFLEAALLVKNLNPEKLSSNDVKHDTMLIFNEGIQDIKKSLFPDSNIDINKMSIQEKLEYVSDLCRNLSDRIEPPETAGNAEKEDFALGTASLSSSLLDATDAVMKELPQVDKNQLLYLKFLEAALRVKQLNPEKLSSKEVKHNTMFLFNEGIQEVKKNLFSKAKTTNKSLKAEKTSLFKSSLNKLKKFGRSKQKNNTSKAKNTSDSSPKLK